jgi:hypothetical protein
MSRVGLNLLCLYFVLYFCINVSLVFFNVYVLSLFVQLVFYI